MLQIWSHPINLGQIGIPGACLFINIRKIRHNCFLQEILMCMGEVLIVVDFYIEVKNL